MRSDLSQGINRESYAPCSPRAPRRLPRIKTPLRRDSGRGHARLGKGCILIGLNFPVYSNISTLTVPLLASCSAEENRTETCGMELYMGSGRPRPDSGETLRSQSLLIKRVAGKTQAFRSLRGRRRPVFSSVYGYHTRWRKLGKQSGEASESSDNG